MIYERQQVLTYIDSFNFIWKVNCMQVLDMAMM